MSEQAPMIYVGKPGSGLGFRLSGIDVAEATTSQEVVAALRAYKEEGVYKIIFVDESLALEAGEEIEKLNEAALPAIVLLPNPAQPTSLSTETINNLIIRAVGSNIFQT